MRLRTMTRIAGVCIVAALAASSQADLHPFPGAGTDVFGSELTHEVEFIANPFFLPVGIHTLSVDGPTTVDRGDPYPGGPGGRHQIDTEIVSMSLTGASFGGVTVTESPTRDSIGLVREIDLSGFPGHFPAISFFDVFFEIDFAVLPGVTIFNRDAAYMFNGNVNGLPPFIPDSDPYIVEGWRDGAPARGFAGETGVFHPLPLPIYVFSGGVDVHVGFLREGTHSVVPAPGAALLAAMGLAMVGWIKRRLIA